MKIKLNADQHYIAADGGIHFGKKGEIVNIDPLFAKLIRDKFSIVKNEEEEEDEDDKTEKPLDKMNKAELTAKIKELGIDITDEEIEAMTKAELIKIIVNAQNA